MAWNAKAYDTIQGNLITNGGFVVLLMGGYQVRNGQICHRFRFSANKEKPEILACCIY